jgi:hypothetical protein
MLIFFKKIICLINLIWKERERESNMEQIQRKIIFNNFS